MGQNIMACGREAILNLYRNLLRESKKWKSYNYREYALRKTKHEFRSNQNLKDEKSIQQCYQNGLESLEVIKKQVIIGNLYSTRPLIIETKVIDKKKAHTGVQ